MGKRIVEMRANARVFEGLARQNMTFHQSLFELVDDALAASRHGEKMLVNVALETIKEEMDSFNLYVTDNGTGMSADELAECLQLGHVPISKSRLNEHGFGFKNSVTILSGGNGSWTLWTKKHGSDKIVSVNGPFDSTMTICDDDGQQFPNKSFINSDTSTVIMVKVKKTYAQTIQGRGAKSNDLIIYRKWLLEHLGVTYRGFLSPDKETNETNVCIQIWVDGTKKVVTPLEVPMCDKKTRYFDVSLGGKVYKLKYEFGLLDTVKRNTMVNGDKARCYYQGNVATQGIDIRLGDRVIATGQLNQIWHTDGNKPLSRDNHYNLFVGELHIPNVPRGVLSTTCNKTDFVFDDPGWTAILDVLNEEEYKPISKGRVTGEETIRTTWKENIGKVDPDDIVLLDKCVWDSGVKIDLYRTKDKDAKPIIIYEFKVGKAAPLDLYQLRMYWDGLILEGIQPDEAYLVVGSYTSKIEEMARKMSDFPAPKMPDGSESRPYKFIVTKHGIDS